MLWANLLHFYQPPTQKKYWIDRITEESYRKIVIGLLDTPKARLTLNVSAVLCELWERYSHLDVIAGIKTLVQRGQVELTGSAKFHPLLPKLPESEVIRQIYLNEVGLHKYFGVVGPLSRSIGGPFKRGISVGGTMVCATPKGEKLVGGVSSEGDEGRNDLQGFFPPEMAYSEGLAKIISKIGYRWIIAEELSLMNEFGKVDYSRLYRVEGAGLLIFFRDRYASFKILSGQLATPLLFLNEFKDKNKEGLYFLTAMDGETFGHHRPGLERTLLEVYKDVDITSTCISGLIKQFSKVSEVKTFPSTWALMEKDTRQGVPYARWDDSDNAIHQMQWDLVGLAILTVNSSKYKLEGFEFNDVDDNPNSKGWIAARLALDESLHSDQFWWASAKPWWSLEMIEGGARQLRDSILLTPDISETIKDKANSLYYRIVTTGFEWQRKGIIDEMSKKNDEDIIMSINETLGKYTKDQIAKMIEVQEKEMRNLVRNEEFEIAVHPRNRIRELKEYLKRVNN